MNLTVTNATDLTETHPNLAAAMTRAGLAPVSIEARGPRGARYVVDMFADGSVRNVWAFPSHRDVTRRVKNIDGMPAV